MSTAPKFQNAQVLDAQHRARNYWFVDGLPQILGGATLILLGVSLWYFFTWSISNFVKGSGLLLALITISLCSKGTLEWLKARVTYPRTGYAPLPPAPQPVYEGFLPPDPITELKISSKNRDTSSDIRSAWLGWFRTTVLVASLYAVWPLLWDMRTPWVCLIAALLLSFVLWFGAYKETTPPWIILAPPWIILVGLPLVGLTMSVLSVERNHRYAELMVGLGILAILDGALTLVRYLLRIPVAGG